MILRTERTILRPWRPSDLPAFERLCADPRVMRYFPRTLPPEMADALARRLIDEMERNGFGAWALEIPGEADFAGSSDSEFLRSDPNGARFSGGSIPPSGIGALPRKPPKRFWRRPLNRSAFTKSSPSRPIGTFPPSASCADSE